jgi:hypothetical protein
MSNAIVLTDGSKFKCAHMAAPIGIQEGITISLTASKITVDNAKPILNGAIISGFTTEKGCTVQPTPCTAFQLSTVSATGSLSENNQKVYIETDNSAIALVVSTGNGQPGLTILETQTKLKA